MNDPSDIVGHKTFRHENGFRHEPLTRAEADEILRHADEEQVRRVELMPDEQTAIRMFFDAWKRLKDMGWKEAMYCPKDGRTFEVIEAGSTGIFRCVYQGEWPKGTFWILEDCDMSPSYPALYRDLPQTSTTAPDLNATTT